MNFKPDTTKFGFSNPFVFLPLIMITIVASWATFVAIADNNKCLTQDLSKWGQLGDTVGGLLNPLLAFFAFLVLFKSFDLQKRELKATNDALENSATHAYRQVELLESQISLQSQSQLRAEILSHLRMASDELTAALSAEIPNNSLSIEDYLNNLPNDRGEYSNDLSRIQVRKVFQTKIGTDIPSIQQVRRSAAMLAALTSKLEPLEADSTFRSFYLSRYPNLWKLVEWLKWEDDLLKTSFKRPDL